MSGSEFGVERLMDRLRRATERTTPRCEGGRPIVRHGAGPFTVRPVVRSARPKAVAAQSLVDYVRLAALCGLLRCEIAEDPKGNRRRRSMRRMPRELASGSSEKRRPVSCSGTHYRISDRPPTLNLRKAASQVNGFCVRY